MCNFDKNDVIKIARAIIEDPLCYMCGDYMPFFYCIYCKAELHGYHVRKEEFKHEIDCPVLVAQDILTGHETPQGRIQQ
jgi:hypothetical protein